VQRLDLGDDLRPLVLGRDVLLDERDAEVRCGPLAGFVRDVADHDAGAVGGEAPRDRQAQA
jgi:hypothetical protein